MVKADIKRDYYADLDLPPTADAEEIKKQFRLLAKQFHPDRNPGHEVEVLPKFQAVQAAHEILIDPVEKQKYDQSRAKFAAKSAATAASTPGYTPDPYSFARSNNPKPTNPAAQFGFPPPPKQKDKRTAFPPPNQKPSSSGADKFNAWTRTAPNSWDRSRFDAAEALRSFSTMRPTQSVPQPPPRPTRQHPTAPRPSPATEIPHVPNVPPTSFPGLSRTQSARKTTGFMPGAYGTADEPPAPRTSAYSYVRADRGQSTPKPTNIHVPDSHDMRSPPVSRARPTVSPLRHTRSSDYDMRSDHPDLSRPSGRYATSSGERTDLHGDGLHRSASVRNSPVEPQWEDRGPFGRSSTRYQHIPRHRSASPKVSSTGRHVDHSSSSDEDEVLNMSSRPKMTAKSRPKPQSRPSQRAADDNPALYSQFPSTNYTKIVDDSQYHYPPPDAREHTRKPWQDMASPNVEKPGHDFGGHGGNTDGPKYAHAPSHMSTQSRLQHYGINRPMRGHSFNGVPSWAVPSSVYPQKTPPRTDPRRGTISSKDHHSLLNPLFSGSSLFNKGFTDTNSSHDAKATPNHAQSTFVASDWHDKVTSDDFKPSESQLRKSPSKTSRPSKPVTRGRGMSRAADQEGNSSSESSLGRTTDHRDSRTSEDTHAKSDAFPPGKLPADWASNVRGSHSRAEAKSSERQRKDDSDSTSSKEPYVVVEEDVMDIDDEPMANGHHRNSSNGRNYTVQDSSRRSSKRTSINGGVDLKEFTQHAPFAPTSTGLKDLDDLSANLPFPSRPEEKVDLTKSTTTNNNKTRPLDLPRPPKCIVPPSDDRLTMDNFTQYTKNMSLYMHEWNNFNAKMIEHFRRRQDQVCGNMLQNWITVRSDGPDAHAHEENGSDSAKPAGYATYMQWLKEDAVCRQWWDHANDLHLQCLEDLGRIREKAKRSFASR